VRSRTHTSVSRIFPRLQQRSTTSSSTTTAASNNHAIKARCNYYVQVVEIDVLLDRLQLIAEINAIA
jgi:hypothetical protein